MKKLFLLLLIFYAGQIFGIQSGEKEPKTIDGIVYHVQPGDSWYSIAKKFHFSYAELRVANKNSGDKLDVGQQIQIPAGKLKANDPFYQKNYLDNNGKSSKEKIVYHEVKSGQTLFSISKLYKVSVDEIKDWNNLKSNSISIGQKLIVGKTNVSTTEKNETKTPEVKEVPKPVVPEKEATEPLKGKEKSIEAEDETEPEAKKKAPASSSADADIKGENSSVETINISDDKIVFANGRREVNETGIAIRNDEEDNNSDKYYAFHRTAPIGTIIRITNVANSNKIYVRVSGTLSDSDEKIIIKISKAGAEKLGATEKLFKVELLYGLNKEN